MLQPTLYDEWAARRKRLGEYAFEASDARAIEANVLDYLLRRFQDSPEAMRPARFALSRELYVNRRAIVVLHHLAGDRDVKIATRSQALARVQSILAKMQEKPDEDCEVDERAWEVFGGCPATDDPVVVLRMGLCDSDPLSRISAALKLADDGALDDIGLFSDLLALPPANDEHPRERAASLYAMQRLAGMAPAPFDVSEVFPRRRAKALGAESPAGEVAVGLEAKRCDWVCVKCLNQVPASFQVCWHCGASADGIADPTFHAIDDE